MDFLGHRTEGFLDGDLGASPELRSKTALRMKYEAEVSVIKKQTGDLEIIRANLGLSARKMCQLLMVDPSAWSRWTKAGEEAPPHIYRALQWYLTLNEKIPGLTPQYFIGGSTLRNEEILAAKMRAESEKLTAEFRAELESKNLHIENERKNQENLEIRVEYYKAVAERGFRDLNSQVQSLEKAIRGEKTKSLFLLALAGLLTVGMAILILKS